MRIQGLKHREIQAVLGVHSSYISRPRSRCSSPTPRQLWLFESVISSIFILFIAAIAFRSLHRDRAFRIILSPISFYRCWYFNITIMPF
jgi:hypothetical protein